MTLWDAARAANKRPLRKPIKFHDPVGDPELNAKGDYSCANCKYIICNCDYVPPPYGLSCSGIKITYNALLARGTAIYHPGEGVVCGLLMRKQLEALQRFEGL